MTENCWVLVDPDNGDEWDNGDYVEHFTSAQKAADKEVSGHAPRQLDKPCLNVVCGCGRCNEIYDEAGDGHVVHFESADEMAAVLGADWTKHPDGAYRCVACSPGGDCECREEAAPVEQCDGQASLLDQPGEASR